MVRTHHYSGPHVVIDKTRRGISNISVTSMRTMPHLSVARRCRNALFSVTYMDGVHLLLVVLAALHSRTVDEAARGNSLYFARFIVEKIKNSK